MSAIIAGIAIFSGRVHTGRSGGVPEEQWLDSKLDGRQERGTLIAR